MLPLLGCGPCPGESRHALRRKSLVLRHGKSYQEMKLGNRFGIGLNRCPLSEDNRSVFCLTSAEEVRFFSGGCMLGDGAPLRRPHFHNQNKTLLSTFATDKFNADWSRWRVCAPKRGNEFQILTDCACIDADGLGLRGVGHLRHHDRGVRGVGSVAFGACPNGGIGCAVVIACG
jgi:hypothetical protein